MPDLDQAIEHEELLAQSLDELIDGFTAPDDYYTEEDEDINEEEED